jgi:predicted GNAT superfamily acetyltransferase
MNDEPTSLDPGKVLTLNNAHAQETSLLDAGSLSALLDVAFYARGLDGGATAFLIALSQDATYDNPNFAWFKNVYESFVYIDRIIVAATARGQGIARLLYRDLFSAARVSGRQWVVCEVNVEPPNPESQAFHAAMGFQEVGVASIRGGTKTVRYFSLNLT